LKATLIIIQSHVNFSELTNTISSFSTK